MMTSSADVLETNGSHPDKEMMLTLGVGLLERIAHDRNDLNGHNISINAIDELREILRNDNASCVVSSTAKTLHYSFRPMIRSAIGLLQLRKPVAPDVEIVISGLQAMLDGTYGASAEAGEQIQVAPEPSSAEIESALLGEPLVRMASMAGALKGAIDLLQNYRLAMSEAEGIQSKRAAEKASAEHCVMSLRQHLVTALRAQSYIDRCADGLNPLSRLRRDSISVERDLSGTIHIKAGDFDFVQVRYQYPYTDNSSTRRLAEKIVDLLAPQELEAPADESLWADRPIYECTGCGTVTRDPEMQLKLFQKAGAQSCCPERNMQILNAKSLKSLGEGAEPDWGVFASYLLDKCEGKVIAEEHLQVWLAEMLEHPHYGSLFRRERSADLSDIDS